MVLIKIMITMSKIISINWILKIVFWPKSQNIIDVYLYLYEINICVICDIFIDI